MEYAQYLEGISSLNIIYALIVLKRMRNKLFYSLIIQISLDDIQRKHVFFSLAIIILDIITKNL